MINNIVIVGAGYVGASLATLLCQKKEVTIVDIDSNKLKLIDQKKSPIEDNLANHYLKKPGIKLITSDNLEAAISNKNIDLIILALPTNYDVKNNYFDTAAVEHVIKKINLQCIDTTILIKSTVPIGFTKIMQEKYDNKKIIFSPEFLREGNAVYDNLYPSRIVIGNKEVLGQKIADLFLSLSINTPKVNLMDSTEAEAVKLFANTYLATRVTFFNELDSFCIKNKLDPRSVIEGVSNDSRIGLGYNNPSFGYGGYCLPKDTKQLLANFEETPQGLFTAVVEGNVKRKKFIAEQVLLSKPKTVGIYRLVMKAGSDNFRESAILDIIKIIESKGVKIYIYEPLLESSNNNNWNLINSLEDFKDSCSIILANRMHEDIQDVRDKVFTRDIFGYN